MKVLRKGPPASNTYLFISCHGCRSYLMLGKDDFAMSELSPQIAGYRKVKFQCCECKHEHDLYEYYFQAYDADSALMIAVQSQLEAPPGMRVWNNIMT